MIDAYLVLTCAANAIVCGCIVYRGRLTSAEFTRREGR
jgi:hypothetical protein